MNPQLDHKLKHDSDYYRRVQLDPKMHEVFRNKDLKKSEKEFHLHRLWAQLHATYSIGRPVYLTLQNRRFLTKKVNEGIGFGAGIAHTYEDSHADVFVSIKGKTLFRAMITLAHEFRHCYQLLVLKRFDEPVLDLEGDAIDFSYDAVTEYCIDMFINKEG